VATAAVKSNWARVAGLAAALAMVAVLAAISLTGDWPKSSSLERITGNGIIPSAGATFTAVEVSEGDQGVIFEHASADSWTVGGGSIPPAVSEHVQAAIRFLHVSNPRRVLEPGEYDAAKLAEFGLDPPRMLVTLVAADGKRNSIALGEATPAENSQYVRLIGQPTVYLLSRYVGMEWQIAADMALRTVPPAVAAQDAARQRHGALLLPVSMAEISAVELVENGALTRFERDPAGDWFHHVGNHVHTPGGFAHKADPKLAPLIAAELAALEQASVETVIAQHPAEDTLAQFGLEHASSIMVLYTRDSSHPVARIEFGKQSEDGFSRYALVRETDSIVRVPHYSTTHVERLLQLAGARS
jgi:hypothetical protein